MKTSAGRSGNLTRKQEEVLRDLIHFRCREIDEGADYGYAEACGREVTFRSLIKRGIAIEGTPKHGSPHRLHIKLYVKNCPCCGEDPHVGPQSTFSVGVECLLGIGGCGLKIERDMSRGTMNAYSDAILAWNQRVGDPR